MRDLSERQSRNRPDFDVGNRERYVARKSTITPVRAADKITLSLNGAVIYQQAVDFGGDHSFGFYIDRTKTAAKIRNVVMTGDWPETLPEDCIANPTVIGDLAVK